MKNEVDSPYAALRLLNTLALMAVGSCGMYVVVVVLPSVQAEFGVARADASVPYTLTMIGFGIGGVLMGRLADRFGVMVPLLIGAASLGVGFIAASMATSIWMFALVHGVVIGGLGAASTFAPLIADTSLWFNRRRGIAVAVCASGNYLAGTIWPPIVQHFVETVGWRDTYWWLGVFCFVTMSLLALRMRRRPPVVAPGATGSVAAMASNRPFGMTPGTAQAWLCVAGLSCCVAMAMPQVHIVALCADLGYGTARGAQMLSLMLGFGIVSRLVFGLICDRIGGLRTLLLAAASQTVALILFLPFDGLVSLYIVSALFGLFQGGIVPAYAIIVREHFSPKEAGARVGTVLMFTMLGMALGGWISGKIYDLTGSYDAAFVNGIAWNLVTVGIAILLLRRVMRPPAGPRLAQAAA